MISISKDAATNYLAKIVELGKIHDHPNADKLKLVTIDFQNVVVGLDAKEGDLYVYFPVESAINTEFLSFTNSFRDKELNKDKEKAGFFEKTGRVRAVKLRGEYSLGYLVPIEEIERFIGNELTGSVGDEFDTIGKTLMCKKYFIPVKEPAAKRLGKKPRISRLVDGQVHLHVDTENLRREAYRVSPEDDITVSYKVHGTSGWVSNVLVKKKLNIIDKVLRSAGFNVKDTEYDFVFGSRRVVKNEYETKGKNDFYDGDLWEEVKDELKEFVPKSYTLYYEILGYTKTGSPIQGAYDYGCPQGKHKIHIYRVTTTNEDGFVTNLSSKQAQEFCSHFGLTFAHVFYQGKAKDMYPEITVDDNWTKNFVEKLEKDYNEKDCFMCVNALPEEGIVLRKEKLFEFESYKLKSFRFLAYETEMMDKGEADIENNN